MFKVGDYISHPMHGAGIIKKIEQRRINGENKYYYVLGVSTGSMTVMVPVDTCGTIGVRPIVDCETAQNVLEYIKDIQVDNDNVTANWNKRYRENMDRLKSGDLMLVASVIKGLIDREKAKGLSTGERKVLRSAKQILVSEISIAMDTDTETIETKLDSLLLS